MNNQYSEQDTFEYRIKRIIKGMLFSVDAEIGDFKTDDELLDFLHSEDIAVVFGRAVVGDMTDYMDDWLEQMKG